MNGFAVLWGLEWHTWHLLKKKKKVFQFSRVQCFSFGKMAIRWTCVFFFILQDPCSLCLPSSFCPTQCGDPSRAAFRCYSNGGGGRRCNLPIPWLYRSGLRAVFGRRHCCCRRRRLWAVSLRSLASADQLHDNSRVRIHCPAAAGNRGHPRSCCSGGGIQPVPAPATPNRSHAVKNKETTFNAGKQKGSDHLLQLKRKLAGRSF